VIFVINEPTSLNMREDLSYLSDKIIWQKQLQVLFYHANQKNRKKSHRKKHIVHWLHTLVLCS